MYQLLLDHHLYRSSSKLICPVDRLYKDQLENLMSTWLHFHTNRCLQEEFPVSKNSMVQQLFGVQSFVFDGGNLHFHHKQ